MNRPVLVASLLLGFGSARASEIEVAGHSDDPYMMPYYTGTILPTPQLRDYVRHDAGRFPQSKMPQFSKLLRSTELDQVVAYLQAMQPAR